MEGISNRSSATTRRQKGFSLIEVIAAAIILAAALLALTRLQADFLQASSATRLQARALNFAQEKIEQLRDFDSSELCNTAVSGSDTTNAGSAVLTRSWQTYDCAHTDATNCEHIDVSVSWTDSQAQTQTVNLSSQLACVETASGGVILSDYASAPCSISMSPSGGNVVKATNLSITYNISRGGTSTITSSESITTTTDTISLTAPNSANDTFTVTIDDTGNGNGACSTTASFTTVASNPNP